MRTLILGGTGMLGQAVAAAARRRGLAALALPRRQADVADRRALHYWMRAFRPEAVINCAAFTKVDACEGEGRREAFRVNGEAVANVAAEAEQAGARLLQLSTDYVFAGNATAPYGEDSPAGPLSAYGESKLAGERRALAYRRALVVRTSWLFGPGGPNFAATIAGLIERGQRQLRVVDDQCGAPTYTRFLAEALLDLGAGGATGIVHFRNRPACTWYAFAREIVRCRLPEHEPGGAAAAAEVVPVTTAEFPRPAPRPAYSVLAVERCEALLGRPVEPWLWGLAEYLTWMREGRSR
jgi:dTDP-4-dehydrorhamnose reductase